MYSAAGQEIILDRPPPCDSSLPALSLFDPLSLPLLWAGLLVPPAGRIGWWSGGTGSPFLAVLNPTADEKSLVGSTMLQLPGTMNI
jgi:hypothetical protein